MEIRPATSSPAEKPTAEAPPREPTDPKLAYRWALARLQPARLAAMAARRGLETSQTRASVLASELTEHLDEPRTVNELLARLGDGARRALNLFALTERTRTSLDGLRLAIALLGEPADAVLLELLELGLMALDPGPEVDPGPSFEPWLQGPDPEGRVRLFVHPSVPRGGRLAPAPVRPQAEAAPVAQVRQADGLEPIIRLGAIWQRVGAEPLRQTQQGTLYKRDRERLDEDPVLAGGIADALEPLPDMTRLWLSLARRVGLIREGPANELLESVPVDFWIDNGVHLPQMVATSWLGLDDWCEWRALGPEEAAAPPLTGWIRPILLHWLGTLGEDEWVGLDELAAFLQDRRPGWDREAAAPASTGLASQPPSGARTSPPRRKGGSAAAQRPRVLESVLLGTAYAFGLVRAAEQTISRKTVVQLTPLGRYVLALGPPPPPPQSFEHFLFIQPNFEIIAYRQGLTPPLIGRLSRFAWWTKIGAALELELKQASIEFGLEGGLKTEAMLELLARHSQRPIPPGVVDAVGRWAVRRERITYYTAATLIEFGSTADRDLALTTWSQAEPQGYHPVGSRFLLVEPPQPLPTDRIRTIGSRDYRLPPERCVTVEPDGVTLVLDPTRSDLLIDAEMIRFADELPPAIVPRSAEAGPVARRFQVGPASLARGIGLGLTPVYLGDWFLRRTGGEISPAIRLLLRARIPGSPPLATRRLIVLEAADAELLDGLFQHPATRPLLAERLGATAAVISPDHVAALQAFLAGLDLPLERRDQ